MPESNVTLEEVFRAVQAMDARWEKAFADSERSQHSLRNRQEAIGLKIAVLETRADTAERDINGMFASAGKIALAISALVGTAFQAISLFWKRP